MEFKQPFCDVEISPEPMANAEYDEMLTNFKGRANRDLKFSDTTFEISTLEYYKGNVYHRYHGANYGYQLGYKVGWKHGIIVGIFTTVLIGVAIYAAVNYWLPPA